MTRLLASVVHRTLIREGSAFVVRDACSGASTAISCAQLRVWIRAVVSAVSDASPDTTRVVGLALPPCSAEESAWVVAVVSQPNWVFVPLDVRSPLERLREVSENAGVDLLITWKSSDIHLDEFVEASSLPPLPGSALQMACFRRRRRGITAWLEPLQHSDARPLYVLSTSGSSGKPKGVVGTRKGALERVDWMMTTLPMDSQRDSVLRATRLSFVDAVAEILGAVLTGVALIHLCFTGPDELPAFVDSIVLHSPRAFVGAVAHHQITRFTSVPSVLRVLLSGITGLEDNTVRDKLSSVQFIMVSGELLTLDVVERLFATFPQTTVVNLYGSTEVSGDILCKEIRSPLGGGEVERWGKRGVPISDFPIRGVGATTQILTVNPIETEKTASQNVPVEILVSGGAVAAGYLVEGVLQRPPNRWSMDDQDLEWFNMGDWCQILGDELYFCGRRDRQVKIRGNRVQLEEIEIALKSVIATDDALMEQFAESEITAMVEASSDADKTQGGGLVAIISRRDSNIGQRTRCIRCTHCDIEEVEHVAMRQIVKLVARDFGSLFAPRDIVVISDRNTPRLSSGKIDSVRLSKIFQLHRFHARAVATKANRRTEAEVKLVEIVARLLGFPNNSIGTNELDSTWLEVGGNSLQATLLSWEIERLTAVSIPHHQIMTIRDLLKAAIRSKRKHEDHEDDGESIGGEVGSTTKVTQRDTSLRRFSATKSSGAWYGRSNLSSHPKVIHQTATLADAAAIHLSLIADVDLHKCVDASPLIVRKDTEGNKLRVLIGSHSRSFVCVEVDSVTDKVVTRWSQLLDDRIEASATTSLIPNLVFVGTYSGRFYALDLDSGVPRWSYQTHDMIKSPSLVIEELGLVVVGSYDRRLYGLDINTGALLWRAELPGSVFAAPHFVTSEKLIVVATTAGTLHTWKATRDAISTLWQVKFSAPIFASTVHVETRSGVQLVVSCADCIVYSLRAADGQIAWTFATRKPIFCTPCVFSTTTGVLQTYALIGSHDGRLRKVSTENGKLEWETDVGSDDDPIFASPCVAILPAQRGDNTKPPSTHAIVCTATTSGRLQFLDERSGSILLSTIEDESDSSAGEIFSSPVVVDGLCFVGTRANRLLVFRLILDANHRL